MELRNICIADCGIRINYTFFFTWLFCVCFVYSLQAAWMFLAEMAKTPVKIKHEAVLDHWKTVHCVVGKYVCS